MFVWPLKCYWYKDCLDCLQLEEEQKLREEQERREHEEYLKLKEAFTVEDEGTNEAELAADVRNQWKNYNHDLLWYGQVAPKSSL